MRAISLPLAVLIDTASGANASARSRSPSPSAIRMRVALGESWMPAPVSSSCSACSSNVTRKPDCASISAALSPPMPAPAMTMLREEATARSTDRSGRFGQGAGLWPCRMRVERRIVPVERRAIWADDLFVVAHVEEDVGMIERRPGADAHEFARADLDHRDAGVIVEVRNNVLGHGFALECDFAVDVAAQHSGPSAYFIV